MVKALAAYLKEKIPSLLAVNDGFPNASQVLKYPCATIFTGKPRITNLMPYVWSKDEDPLASGADVGKYGVRTINGQYEFPLQIDVWLADKPSRHTYWELMDRALNPVPSVPGLRLALGEEYYGLPALFTVTDMDFMGDGDSSARNEYRVRIDVLADMKKIAESNEFLMQQLDTTFQTPPEIPVEEEDDSGEPPII